MRYQNDVIRLVLLHIRANLGMILALHVTRLEACTKQRAQTQMACKKSGFKSYRPRVGPIETHGSCTAAATKSQEAHACYSSNVCGHSTLLYS